MLEIPAMAVMEQPLFKQAYKDCAGLTAFPVASKRIVRIRLITLWPIPGSAR